MVTGAQQNKDNQINIKSVQIVGDIRRCLAWVRVVPTAAPTFGRLNADYSYMLHRPDLTVVSTSQHERLG